MRIKAEIVVVGSGAGGAAVARDLAKQGKDVLLLERGESAKAIGNQRDALGFYDKCALRKSKEGVTVYRALMPGGTTVVSCGNGMVVLEKELKGLGVDISLEAADTMEELGVKPLSGRLIGKGSRLIMDIGNRFGLDMKPMPKAMDQKKCVSCGLCVLGCKTGSKWSAVSLIEEMLEYGGNFIAGIDVKNIAIHKRKAVGLIAKAKGRNIKIYAKKIILAAGALGTPVILRRSGVFKAGNKLFADLLNVTYGIMPDENFNLFKEPTMAVVSAKFLETKGFLIAPFIDVPLIFRWTMPKHRHIQGYRHKNLIGVMTKIKDDNLGSIWENETFNKIVTENDHKKLNEGAEICRRIILEAGAKKDSIYTTKPRGAHPGGSAAIGEVVDSNLKTELDNLYICDASVLPVSSGAPPIVTIVALAKRLAKHLNKG